MSYPSDLQKSNDSVSSLINLFNKSKAESVVGVNVASLAFFKKVTTPYDAEQGFGIIEAQVFPVDEGFDMCVNAYFFSNISFSENEIVLLVFTDKDFRQVIRNKKWTKQTIKNETLHSKQFGVVVKL